MGLRVRFAVPGEPDFPWLIVTVSDGRAARLELPVIRRARSVRTGAGDRGRVGRRAWQAVSQAYISWSTWCGVLERSIGPREGPAPVRVVSSVQQTPAPIPGVELQRCNFRRIGMNRNPPRARRPVRVPASQTHARHLNALNPLAAGLGLKATTRRRRPPGHPWGAITRTANDTSTCTMIAYSLVPW